MLTGLNGSGKTHLLKAISEGKVRLEGIDTNQILYYHYTDFVVSKSSRSDNVNESWGKAIIDKVKDIGRRITEDFFSQRPESDWLVYQYRDNFMPGGKYDIAEARQAFQGLQSFGVESIMNVVNEGGKRYPTGPASMYEQVENFYVSYHNAKGNHEDFTFLALQEQVKEILSELNIEEKLTELYPEFYQFLKRNAKGKDIFNLTEADFGPFDLFLQSVLEEEKQHQVRRIKDALREKNIIRGNALLDSISSPITQLNSVLEEYDYNGYRLAVDEHRLVQDSSDGVKIDVQVKLKRADTNSLVDFEHLSSGEKTLMALSFLLYKEQKDKVTQRVLLFDEVDASLHPSMIQRLIDIIQDIFIDRRGMKVILATHSPTTVALSPEESIFVISNEDGKTTIQKQDKQNALDLLTDGMVVVNEEEARLGIEYNLKKANPPIVLFTEGRTDQIIIEAAWKKLHVNKPCPFYIEPCYGARNLRINFINMDFIKKNPDKLFIALFDFDDAYDEWNALGKGFDDIEDNPRRCLTKKHKDRSAYCMLLPVPNEKNVAKEVLCTDSGNETYGAKSNLPIELMFCNVPKLKHLFSTQPTRGGGEENIFTGNKTKFANQIATIDSEHFEVFIPIFDKIDQIIKAFKGKSDA